VTFGLMNQALDQTIARRLVDAHAKDLGLTVSEAELAASIRDNPALTGPTGFDKSRFDMFLRSVGLSEKAYVEALRQDTVRARLVDGLTGPAAAPAIAADKILAYQGERRRGRALIVQADDIQVPEPDEAALKAYLEANARRYEAPELRDVTLVVVGPDELASDISLTEADLRAEYEHTGWRTTAPPPALDRAAPGRRRGGGEGGGGPRGRRRVALGSGRGDAGARRGADRTRAAAPGRPARGAGQGRVLARRGRGEPAGPEPVRLARRQGHRGSAETLRPFEEVRAELEQELRRQRAGEQLPAFATRLDDEVAGGATLEAAAERLGVPVLKAAGIDRQGQNEKQEAVAADRLVPDVLEAVFAGTRATPR
jgi:peptidyl-prolyl cis-trans isomerase D